MSVENGLGREKIEKQMSLCVSRWGLALGSTTTSDLRLPLLCQTGSGRGSPGTALRYYSALGCHLTDLNFSFHLAN